MCTFVLLNKMNIYFEVHSELTNWLVDWIWLNEYAEYVVWVPNCVIHCYKILLHTHTRFMIMLISRLCFVYGLILNQVEKKVLCRSDTEHEFNHLLEMIFQYSAELNQQQKQYNRLHFVNVVWVFMLLKHILSHIHIVFTYVHSF